MKISHDKSGFSTANDSLANPQIWYKQDGAYGDYLLVCRTNDDMRFRAVELSKDREPPYTSNHIAYSRGQLADLVRDMSAAGYTRLPVNTTLTVVL